jgi:hypothetical protein
MTPKYIGEKYRGPSFNISFKTRKRLILFYFPMQNFPKILFRISSDVVSPTSSPR